MLVSLPADRLQPDRLQPDRLQTRRQAQALFALRSLRRWTRGLLKQGAIALLTLTILLNLGVDASRLDQLTATSIPRELHGSLIGEPLDSAQPARQPSNQKSHPEAYFGEAYFGLDAHMTHYRITRARLSTPYALDAHPVSHLDTHLVQHPVQHPAQHPASLGASVRLAEVR